jgi:hypothetical protein
MSTSTLSGEVLFEASPRRWLAPPRWLAGLYALTGLAALWVTLQGVTISSHLGPLSWAPPLVVIVGVAIGVLEGVRAARFFSLRYRIVGGTLEVSVGIVARRVRLLRQLGSQFQARASRDAVILEAPGQPDLALEGLDEADADTLRGLLAQLPPHAGGSKSEGDLSKPPTRPSRRWLFVLGGLLAIAALAGEARARRERETRARFDAIAVQTEKIVQAEVGAFARPHQALFTRRVEGAAGLTEADRAWLLTLAQHCMAYEQSKSQHVGWSFTEDSFTLEVGVYTPEPTNRPKVLPIRQERGTVWVHLRRPWSVWPAMPTVRLEREPGEASELFAERLSAALERAGVEHEVDLSASPAK